MSRQKIELYYDSETYKFIKDNEVYIKPYYIGINYNSKHHFFKTTISFFDWILRITELKKIKNVDVYIYNMTYDLSALLFDFKFDPYFKGIEFKFNYNDRKQIIKAEINFKNIIFTFFDLWVWNKTKSYKSWCKELGLPEKKDIIDYDKWDANWRDDKLYYFTYNLDSQGNWIKEDNEYYVSEEIEKEYLDRDVLNLPIIKENIIQQQKKIIELVNNIKTTTIYPKKGATTPGFSKKIFNALTNNFIEEKMRNIIPKEYYTKLKAGRVGGFTAFNKKILTYQTKDNEQIITYDVNSMYPSIITKYRLPYGAFLDNKPEGDNVKWICLTIYDFKYKEKYNFLSSDFLKWSNLGKEIIITEEYLNICNEIYELDYIIHWSKFQKTTDILQSLFKYLYSLKENANTPEVKNQSKLLLNSLFGKLFERTYDTELIMLEDFELTLEEVLTDYFNIATGMFITFKGRELLFKTIKDIIDNNDTLLYTDTDSVKFITTKNNITYLWIDNKKLGAWKNEGSYTYYTNPKKNKRYYFYNNKLKKEIYAFSGFVKSCITDLSIEEKKIFFSPNNNILVIKGKKIVKTNTLNQKIIFNVDIETNNKLPINYILEKTKEEKWELKPKNL